MFLQYIAIDLRTMPRTMSTPYEGPSVSPLPLPRPKSDLPPSPMYTPWRRHTIKQLKLVLPGAAVTYYLGTIHVFLNILHGTGGFWARYGYYLKSII